MFDHGPDATKALMDVLKSENAWRRPIWFMRQAGRYLPEYRKVRAEAGSFLNLCFNSELACEVTLQPLSRFDLDAAILFADILLLPMALGQNLEFRENEGPVLSPIRSNDDLRLIDDRRYMDTLEPVFETVRQVRSKIPGHVTLIGFCGAPWTVATYMVEGGTSPDRARARIAAYNDESWFNFVVDRLVDCSVDYLCAQITAGAEVVQIFDTWAGDLPDGLCEKYCFEPIKRIVDGVRERFPGFPVIGFARGIGVRQIAFARYTGVDAVGIEWSFPMNELVDELSMEVVVQGNLDPLVLMSSEAAIRQSVENVVGSVDPSRHIMNLGHGIKPETQPENVKLMIDVVREFDQRV